MKMPFGKYRGAEIEDLPSDYLDWLMTIKLQGPLQAAVKGEWKIRFKAARKAAGYAAEEQETAPPPAPPRAGLDDAERRLLMEVVRAGYRALARKYHPDLEGGNPEMMVDLNRLMDRLKDLGAAW